MQTSQDNQNTKTQALQQIEEIRMILQSSNELLMSGSRIMGYGIVLALVPLIEIPSQLLSFGFDFGDYRPLVLALSHVVFYVLLFQLVKWTLGRLWQESKKSASHPVLKQALRIDRPIFICIVASIFIFFQLGFADFIFPFVMIFFGLLLNLYGRLSSSLVLRLSWSYIFFGFLNLYLTHFNWPHLWIIFDTYLSLSFVAMGIYLNSSIAKA